MILWSYYYISYLIYSSECLYYCLTCGMCGLHWRDKIFRFHRNDNRTVYTNLQHYNILYYLWAEITLCYYYHNDSTAYYNSILYNATGTNLFNIIYFYLCLYLCRIFARKWEARVLLSVSKNNCVRRYVFQLSCAGHKRVFISVEWIIIH